MGEQRRILIIGDEGLFVEALERFSPAEFSVAHAVDVEEARAACAERAPAVVIAQADGDATLAELLAEVHRDRGALCVGLGGADGAIDGALFDHLIASADSGGAMDEAARIVRGEPGPRRSWTDEARQAVQQPAPDGSRSAQLVALARQLDDARVRRQRPQDPLLGGLKEAQEELGRQQALCAAELERLQRALDDERRARVAALEALAARQAEAQQGTAAQQVRVTALGDGVAALQTRVDGLALALRTAVRELEQLRGAALAGFAEGEASTKPVAPRVGRGATSEIERLIPAVGAGGPPEPPREDSVVAEVSFASETASFVREPGARPPSASRWRKGAEDAEENAEELADEDAEELAAPGSDDGPTITDTPAAARGAAIPVGTAELIVEEEYTAEEPTSDELPAGAKRSAITAEGPAAAERAEKARAESGRAESLRLAAARWPYWVAAAIGLLALALGLVLLFWDHADAGQPAAAGSPVAAVSVPRGAAAGARVRERATAPAAGPARADAAAAQRPPAVDARPRTVPRTIDLRRRHLGHARALLRQGRIVEARAQVTAALQLADDAYARELLADAHERAGERWAAAHHVQKAIALAPPANRVALQHRLGALLVQLGKTDRGCEAFRAALRQEPGHAGAKALLAQHCAR